MTSLLAQPLTLPCGATVANRLSKAAMTEGLATADGVPTAELNLSMVSGVMAVRGYCYQAIFKWIEII